jgi:hypothetical protein
VQAQGVAVETLLHGDLEMLEERVSALSKNIAMFVPD